MFETLEFINSQYSQANSTLFFVPAGFVMMIVGLNLAQHLGHSRPIPFRAIAIITTGFWLLQLTAYKPSQLVILGGRTTKDYFDQLHKFRELRLARSSALPAFAAKKEGSGETYVLVIGEAQNKAHMSAYGYFRKTTPWLDEQIKQPGWLKFEHAYSSAVETVPALTLALTSANQYNRGQYYGSPSIVDILKAAGFRTYWMSNQRGIGPNDNPISAIAELSDFFISTNKHIKFDLVEHGFDLRLVEIFKLLTNKIDAHKNNFIVFHLQGNHALYCNRFPHGFGSFGASNFPGIEFRDTHGQRLSAEAAGYRIQEINCYDNSVLYTDLVLAKIYSEARKLAGFRAFLYLPDHAEDVYGGLLHNTDTFTYAMTHIPMIAWLSPDFEKSYPDRAKALRANSKAIWTNDLLYDLVLGLTGVQTEHYEARYDLSSSSFRLDSGLALTLEGARKVIDDPELFGTIAN